MLHTLLTLLIASHPAPRQTVERSRADHYALADGRTVITNACTVTTDGLVARLDASASKPWIYFYDADGAREADCMVLAIVTPYAVR